MGLREIATFTTFHRVLNRNRWVPHDLACRLLHQLVETFVPAGPVAIVRAKLWSGSFEMSRLDQDQVKIPQTLLSHLTEAACFPA
ncbi:hypothetical protein ACFQY9_26985 [Microvirga aerilata]|jgi:hypothetical protein